MFYEFFFNWIVNILQNFGYPFIFVLSFLEIVFTPLPSEIVLPFVGYLAWKENNILILIFSIPISAAGATLGSLILYYIGYYSKDFFYKYGKYFFISRINLIKAQKFFLEYKEIMLIIGRFVPGIRSLISIPAGIFQVNKKIFVLYSFIAFCIWSFILISFGYFLGNQWEKTKEYSNQIDILGIILFISFLIYYYFQTKQKRFYKKKSIIWNILQKVLKRY